MHVSICLRTRGSAQWWWLNCKSFDLLLKVLLLLFCAFVILEKSHLVIKTQDSWHADYTNICTLWRIKCSTFSLQVLIHHDDHDYDMNILPTNTVWHHNSSWAPVQKTSDLRCWTDNCYLLDQCWKWQPAAVYFCYSYFYKLVCFIVFTFTVSEKTHCRKHINSSSPKVYIYFTVQHRKRKGMLNKI